MNITKSFSFFICIILLITISAPAVLGALEKGTPAPNFSGTDQNGKKISLEYYKGQNMLIYFIKYLDDTVKEELLSLNDFKTFFNVLIISSTEEGYNDTLAYLKNKKLGYSVLMDKEKKLQDLYSINYQFPTLYIINNNSKVCSSRMGFIKPVETFLGEYLKEAGLSVDYNPAETGKPWIGLLVIELPGYLKDIYNVEKGLYIGKVMPSSPAQASGFQVGDIITEFDNKKVEDEGDVTEIIEAKKVGDSCNVKLIRKNPEKLTLTLLKEGNPAGWEIDEMPDALKELYGVEKGVIVKEVEKNGSAEKQGFKAFDLIISADGKSVENKDDVNKIMDGKKSGEKTTFSVIRLKNEQISSSVVIGIK